MGIARARAHAHTHIEERNLSLTRILNGCAEARTVGTYYSTTHPPPLRQNSISFSSLGLPSPLFAPSVPRLFLSVYPFRCPPHYLSHSLASQAPFPHSLAAGSSRSRYLGSPSISLLLSRVHPALMVKLFLCNCVCVWRIASSFHSVSRSIFFLFHYLSLFSLRSS